MSLHIHNPVRRNKENKRALLNFVLLLQSRVEEKERCAHNSLALIRFHPNKKKKRKKKPALFFFLVRDHTFGHTTRQLPRGARTRLAKRGERDPLTFARKK